MRHVSKVSGIFPSVESLIHTIDFIFSSCCSYFSLAIHLNGICYVIQIFVAMCLSQDVHYRLKIILSLSLSYGIEFEAIFFDDESHDTILEVLRKFVLLLRSRSEFYRVLDIIYPREIKISFPRLQRLFQSVLCMTQKHVTLKRSKISRNGNTMLRSISDSRVLFVRQLSAKRARFQH